MVRFFCPTRYENLVSAALVQTRDTTEEADLEQFMFIQVLVHQCGLS